MFYTILISVVQTNTHAKRHRTPLKVKNYKKTSRATSTLDNSVVLESVWLKNIKITLQCLVRFIKISTYTTCESQRGEHAAKKVKTTEDVNVF